MSARAILLLLIAVPAMADINVLQMQYRDQQPKVFGYDEPIIVVVDGEVPPQRGLRARVFGGTTTQLLRGQHRTTQAGCKVFETLLVPLHSIPGRVNLGFLADETWLSTTLMERSDPARTPSWSRKHRRAKPSFRSPPATRSANTSSTRSRFKSFRPEPRENPDPLASDQMPSDTVARVAYAATIRETRILEVQQMPEKELQSNCTAFRLVPPKKKAQTTTFVPNVLSATRQYLYTLIRASP